MKTIFLIDDDPDDREIFAELLQEEHPSIAYQEAENGAAAFEKLKSGSFKKPELIFLDLNMPVMDGRTFLLEIKKETSLLDIPIIIYSTSSSEIDKKFAQENGAALFLTKQYSMDLQRKDINAAVSAFLGI
ncbi:response regulator [Flavobacterium defluvii]|uniref:Response regulator receiver domain-containing protein n=1 Tax=Flavobacterium defluvii TaxID=370979 RepID=A0A1M5IZD3_9FLAO|nr:response regulator [Flavobacterium defluvii]SHG33123.1 Response regulator receiver domain-containing protein [Flavobacterium defluvii]